MRWFVGFYPKYCTEKENPAGLKLPKDMTFVHHFPPNYFGADYFDDEECFPQGPWSNEPPSVNWETGLGL